MVTKETFLKYEKVRQSGKYNMITNMVRIMFENNINFNDYQDIIHNYSTYYDKYINEKD